MSIAHFTEAERTLRELLESLRKQVAAAVDQSHRLRAGIAEAHAMSATLHQGAAQLPDPAFLNDRIETGLAEAQSKLDEMTQASLTRVAGQMRRAKSDLEILVTDTVMAFERSAEQARRAASGISRTVDEKLNRAVRQAEEIVAMLEAHANRQTNPSQTDPPLPPSANGQLAPTVPPAAWAMAISSAMNPVPESSSAPADVPQPVTAANLEAIEQGLSNRVEHLVSQVHNAHARPRNVEISDAAA
jgi:hypothetical protein